MKIFTKEVKIGIAGIIALCLLVFGLNYLKGIRMFQSTNYYFVKFKNANALTKSSAVFADGFRVGIVRNIKYDYIHPGNVVAKIDVNPDLRIPKGSSVELVSDLMGNLRLQILLNNNPIEKVLPGDTLNGDIKKGMIDKAEKMMPEFEQMVPKLDSILSSLQLILSDKSIPSTLHSVEKTTKNLAQISSKMKALMYNDIPGITGKLNIIGDNLVTISDSLKDIDYKGTMMKIDQTISNVKLITEKINSKNNTLGLLLSDDGLYNHLNTSAEDASKLLEDLKAHPKRYVHFSVFGKKEKSPATK